MVIGVEDGYLFVQHVPNIYLSCTSERIRLLIGLGVKVYDSKVYDWIYV